MKKLMLFPFLLFACQKPSASRNERPQGQAPEAVLVVQHEPSSQTDTMGTEGLGGGNSIKGQMIESYIKDISSLPSFEKHLNVLLKKNELNLRAQKHLDENISKVLSWIIKEKKWYFIPGPLSALSSEKIGAVVTVDQIALQGFDSIWIDRDLFEKLPNENEKAKLLAHEILMGVKILRFESTKTKCEVLRGKGAYCSSKSNERTGSASDLTHKDYEEIRDLTDKLISDLDTTLRNLNNLLVKLNFNFTENTFKEDVYMHLSQEKVVAHIKKSLSLGFDLRHAYLISDLKKQNPEAVFDIEKPLSKTVKAGTVWKPSDTCQISIQEEDTRTYLQFKVGHFVHREEILTDEWDKTLANDSAADLVNGLLSFNSQAESLFQKRIAALKDDEKAFHTRLFLKDGLLQRAILKQGICSKRDGKGHCKAVNSLWDKTGFEMIVCSNEKQFQY